MHITPYKDFAILKEIYLLANSSGNFYFDHEFYIEGFYHVRVVLAVVPFEFVTWEVVEQVEGQDT